MAAGNKKSYKNNTSKNGTSQNAASKKTVAKNSSKGGSNNRTSAKKNTASKKTARPFPCCKEDSTSVTTERGKLSRIWNANNLSADTTE